jgi:hypothetical protein
MTDNDDNYKNCPAVGAWLALWVFIMLVLTALLYGASR